VLLGTDRAKGYHCFAVHTPYKYGCPINRATAFRAGMENARSFDALILLRPDLDETILIVFSEIRIVTLAISDVLTLCAKGLL